MLALDWGEWLAWGPGRFTPGERAPGTHYMWGWVGSRAGQTVATAGNQTLLVQPAASDYSHWAESRQTTFVYKPVQGNN
jgi:hypothetical protein